MTNSMPMPRSRCSLQQKIENLRLDRHVERGRRLVGDQQGRIAGQRHGDCGALPHPAGKFVRILPCPPSRIGNADLIQKCDCRIIADFRSRIAVDADRLGYLVAHGEDRIEARHRLLEHHADVVAADLAAFCSSSSATRSRIVPSLHLKRMLPAAIAPTFRVSRPHDRQAGYGLAGTGFADKRNGFARRDRQVDALTAAISPPRVRKIVRSPRMSSIGSMRLSIRLSQAGRSSAGSRRSGRFRSH